MGSEFLRGIAMSCLGLSLAILLVLLVRKPLRSVFGASSSYLIWIAVPLAAMTPMLPTAQMQTWSFIPSAPVHLTNEAVQVAANQSDHAALWLIALWGLGVVLVFMYFAVQHVRFKRAVGPLMTQRSFLRTLRRTKNDLGPLLMGLWRPVIVVPSNFRQRYGSRERSLILAHERAHLERLDPIANVVCAGIQCLFWFNPLVHLGAQEFRFDQELGCDDIVMRRYPNWCRSYAEAILKTQTASQANPLACQWQAVHPLKVRIMQLERSVTSKTRRVLGRTLIAATVAVTTFGAWSAQGGEASADVVSPVSSGPIYEIEMTFKAGDEVVNPRIRTKAGIPALIEFGTAPKIWSIKVDLSPRDGSQVASKLEIRHEQKLIASPKLIHELGQKASVRIGAKDPNPELYMQLLVKEWKAPS
jgi:beta-lactamase regulating signal transducer with metallopeptidase domain